MPKFHLQLSSKIVLMNGLAIVLVLSLAGIGTVIQSQQKAAVERSLEEQKALVSLLEARGAFRHMQAKRGDGLLATTPEAVNGTANEVRQALAAANGNLAEVVAHAPEAKERTAEIAAGLSKFNAAVEANLAAFVALLTADESQREEVAQWTTALAAIAARGPSGLTGTPDSLLSEAADAAMKDSRIAFWRWGSTGLESDLKQCIDALDKAGELLQRGRASQAVEMTEPVGGLLRIVSEMKATVKDAQSARTRMRHIDAQEVTPAREELTVKIKAAVDGFNSDASALVPSAESAWALVLTLGLTVSAALVAMTVYSARAIAAPIREVALNLTGLTEGNTDVEVSGLHRHDEIGQMARALAAFRETLMERRMLEGKVRQSRSAEAERQRGLERHIERFKSAIAEASSVLATEISTMRDAAHTLLDAAKSASAEARSSAEVSESAADNSNAVAAATEELGFSIREISLQAQRTNAIVEDATHTALRTNGDVTALAEAAEKIGSVVALIRGIAEQTNLLALNATIEAARAGESGRGFAVVASEVKTLSAQTAKATDAIAEQIHGMQGSTNAAVASIAAISAKVSDIQSLTGAIAAAVEEQTAATQEISRNVSLAASGSRKAARNSEEVTSVAKKTGVEAAAVSASSDRLHSITAELGEAVSGFVDAIGADLERRRAALVQAVDRAVVTIDGSAPVEVAVSDASATGGRIRYVSGLHIGQPLNVDAGGGPAPARIVAIDRTHATLEFVKHAAGFGWNGGLNFGSAS